MKSAKEKQCPTYKETLIHLTADYLSEKKMKPETEVKEQIKLKTSRRKVITIHTAEINEIEKRKIIQKNQ